MSQFYPAIFRRAKAFLFVAIFLLLPAALLFAQTPVVINTSGLWTVPAGVTSVKVEVWGGGGGGGGVQAGTGGGGGGGSYITSAVPFTVIPGQSYTVTIGAGGFGGNPVSGGNGMSGDPTTFTGPGGTLTAAGGSPGGGGLFGGAGVGGNGGAGGINGGLGGSASLTNGAGGGGGAGNTTAGGDGSNSTFGIGGTGTPNVAPNVGGNGGAVITTDGIGKIGLAPGGGGGGAKDGTNKEYNGGAGGAGQVVLTYTVNITPTISSFSPGSGCANTNPVIITGTNFVDGSTSVSFGVSPAFSVVFNSTTQITATPAAGTTGLITVTTPGGTATSAGSFTVNQVGTIALASGNPNPNLCVNSGSISIVYNIGGGTTGAILSGTLPAGVNGVYSSGTFTISGIPTSSGSFPFTVTTTGSLCTNPSLGGTINVGAGIPATPGLITQPTGICESSPGNSFSITPVAGATSYAWSVTGTEWLVTAGGTTTFATVTIGTGAGTVSVTATNGCGTSAVSTTGIIIPNSKPVTPGTITQPANKCSSSIGNIFSIAPVAGATSYTWTATGTGWSVASGGTSTSAIITIGSGAGIVSVIATNACGNRTASTTGSITPTTSAAPGPITQPTNKCAGSTGNVFSIAPVAGATSYTWTVTGTGWAVSSGGTTTSATISIGTGVGAASVTATNECGASAPSTTGDITPTTVPATPGLITRPTNACENSTGNIFSITPVAGATSYAWSVTGTAWSVTSGGASTSATVTIGTGAGSVSVTATNECGTSAASSTGSTTPGTKPGTPGTITQPANNCAGSAGNTFSIASVTGATSYTWSVTGTGWSVTSGGTTNSAMIYIGTGAGSVSVTATNACGTSAASTTGSITPTTKPVTPGSITQPTNKCSGSTGNIFSVAAVTGATSYTWSATGTGWSVASGGTSTSAIITIGTGTGVVSVIATNACGNSTASTTGNIIPTTSAAPGTITQPTDKCSGSTGNIFSITPVAGATSYTWTVTGTGWAVAAGGTTISATITIGTGVGTVSVTATNACGTSAPSATGNITPTSAPATPGLITRPTNTCESSTVNIFIITPVSGAASYTWSVTGTGWSVISGGASTSATITIGTGAGAVSVTATNACGTSAASTTGTITPTTKPGTPGTITQPENNCAGSAGNTFSIASVTGATSYTWSVTGTGWSVTSGGTTNSAMIYIGTGAGSVSVTATNACGTSAASTTGSITPTTKPVTPGSITQPTNKCSGSTGNIFSVAAVTGATSYTWSVTGTGWAVTSGGATNSAIITIGAGAGSVSVTATNGCGTSAASTTGSITPTTKPGTPGLITQPTNKCSGTTGNIFSVAAVTGATSYTWTVTGPGWDVTSGGTTISATITIGTGAGSVSVTATNGCGTSAAVSTGSITPTTLPATPGTITQPANKCSGTTGNTFSIATVIGATSYTWSVTGTGWAVTSGGSITSAKVTIGTGVGSVSVTATNGCGTSTASTTGSIIPSPIPAQPGTITGSAVVCPGASQNYSIAAVAGATTYTWKVPTGWSITGGQGTTTITATSGTAGQNGNISVTAGNLCGTSSASQTINITPANGAYNTGYTGNSNGSNVSGTINVNDNGNGLRGYIKFPLTAVPLGSAILSSTLSLTNNGSQSGSNAINFVKQLNADPATTNGSTLYTAIADEGNGVQYNPSSWAATGTIVLPLNNNATADIQSKIGGYIAMGLTRGGTYNYIFDGYAGPNPPVLGVTYSIPGGNLAVTVSRPTANAITGPKSSLCMNETLALVSNGSGVAPLTVSWASSNTARATVDASGVVTGISAGTTNITYTVTDGNGCSTTSANYAVTIVQIPVGTLTLSENSGNPPLNNGIICAGGTVTFTATAGFGSYEFRVNGTIARSASTVNIWSTNALEDEDVVTVNVANSNNCGTTFNPLTITVIPIPIVTFTATENSGTPDNNTICALENVSFTATGGTNYTFKINGSSITTNTTGTYSSTTLINGDVVTVDVKNANNCTATSAPITITVNAIPVGTLTASKNNICVGEEVTFTATGGTSYRFLVDGNEAQPFSGTNTFSTTTLADGQIVTVEVSNAAGCIVTYSPGVAVNVNPLPTGTLTATENSGVLNDESICANAPVTFTFSATNYSTYEFFINNVSKLTTGSNSFITTALAAGDVVTVKVTSGSSCSATFTGPKITIAPSPVANLTVSPSNAICAGDEVVFTADPGTGNTYHFKIGTATAQNGSDNTYTTTALANGEVVAVEVTNSNSCVTISNAITMVVSPLPTGALVPVENAGTANDGIICTGTTVEFTAPAGFTKYNFILDGVSVQSGTSNTYTNSSLITGNKVVVALTNAGGCIGLSNEISITVNLLPTVAPITGAFSVCLTKTTTLSDATAGGIWSSLNPGIATIDASGIVTGVAAGDATINYIFTNANGCTSIVSEVVTVNLPPTVAPITGNLNLCVGFTSQLENITSGGVWSSGNTAVATVDATGLVTAVANGTATISYTVTDVNGCTTVVSADVSVMPFPLVQPITAIPTGRSFDVCIGGTLPLKDATASGVWSSSDNTKATVSPTGVVTGVTSGTVIITYSISTSCGQTASAEETVTVNAAPSATIAYSGSPYCTDGGPIAVTTQTGTTGGTYSISGGLTIDAATGTITPGSVGGTYSVTYTVAASGGCSIYSTTASVTITKAPSATIAYAGPYCTSSAAVTPTRTGTAGGTYSSTPGLSIAANGTITPSTSTAGTYTVTYTVAAANGCGQFITDATVIITAAPSGTISYTGSPLCTSTAPVSVLGTVTPGGTYSYTGTGTLAINVTTGTITPASSTGGTYNVIYTIAASGGCGTFKTQTPVTITAAPTAVAGVAPVLTCANTGAKNITAGSSATNYSSVLWSGNGTFTDATSLTLAKYTPTAAEITAGTATITLTANGNGSCAAVSSQKTITISAITPITTLTASPSTLCLGESSNLVIPSGTPGTLISENFNGTSTFSVVNTGTNSSASSWTNRTSTYRYRRGCGWFRCDVDVSFNSGSKFMLANSDEGNGATNTALVSPTVNTVGYTALTLTYKTYLRRYSNELAVVEVSTNGGTSWTVVQTLANTIGAANKFVPQTINLNSYINNSSLLIRFRYSGNDEWWWAIDDVSLTGTNSIYNYSWTASPSVDAGLPAGSEIPSLSNANIIVTPTASGSYVYKATLTNGAGCTSTNSVSVAVAAIPNVKITADYCIVGGKVRLTANGTPGVNWTWSTGETTQSIDVDIAGDYDVTVFIGSGCPATDRITVAQELVTNGNFDDGNTGFVTPPLGGNQYKYVADGGGNSELNPEGLYGIGPDAHTYHNNFWGHDHTTGTGNFMIINGFPNGNPQPIVWQDTVSVLPSTTYYFSAWGMSLNSSGPYAQLRFDVNGTQVGSTATLAAGVNNNSNNGWTKFYGTLTTGPNVTSAVISIVDLQNSPGGNDFGLDDISFSTLSTFVRLESESGSDAQTPCVNTVIDPIIYSVGSSASAPIVLGLPDGVTSFFNGVLVTISGSPIVPGNYSYSVTTTGSCQPSTATGTINVLSQKITLSSGSATQSLCINTPVSIGYTLSGTADNATITGLAGATTTLVGKVFTINWTPTTAGSFPFSVVTSGTDCTPVTVTGTITVTQQTIALSSAALTDAQTVCINSPITTIKYTVAGTGTGANIVWTPGVPTGITSSYASGIFQVIGTPTQSGSFSYVVTTTGTCAGVPASGTLNITAAASMALTSGAGTDGQTSCNKEAITTITYAINDATGASITSGAFPAGITGAYSAGIYTISGIPTVGGVSSYTITTSGGCATASMSGTITVTAQTIALTSGTASPSVCANVAIPTNIVYTISGAANGASVTGLPVGMQGIFSGNTVTISGAPTDPPGPYPYTVTTSGSSCTPASLTGTITIQPAAVGGMLTSVSICSGTGGTLTLTGNSINPKRWEYLDYGSSVWVPVSNTTISLIYPALISGRQYRAVVGNNCGDVYSSIAMVGIHNLWTGATSTDWNTASNWSDNQLPTTSCPIVYIPGTIIQPVLNNLPVATIINLQIGNGASLIVKAAGTLQISGAITNAGTFDARNGAIEFNGTSLQTIGITFKDSAINDLVISNNAGVTLGKPVNVYRSLTFNSANGKINTAGILTLKSNINNTAWVGQMTGAQTITGDVTVERFINTGISENPKAHRKSWNLLAVPTDGAQTIHKAWQEGAGTINTSQGDPNPGYGTMIVSNKGGASGAIGLGFDQFTAPGPSIKVYNPTTGDYDGPQNTLNTSIYNIKGYLVLVRGDRSVFTFDADPKPTILRSKGELFTPAHLPPSSSVSVGLFESVGNPYASAIDLRKITVGGGLSSSFIVWDPRAQGAYSLGAFTTLTKFSNGNFYAIPGSKSYPDLGLSVPYNTIESGQAFFIQSALSTGTISFTENAKATGSNPTLLRGQGEPGRQSQLRTNMYVSPDVNSTLTDGTLIQFDASYSNNIDGLDARKLTNTSENLAMVSNKKILAVERRASIVETDTVFFKISGMRVQPYKFEFIADDLTEFGVEGIIEDNYLQTKTPLNMEGKTEYSFTIENKPGSYASDRFRIVFKEIARPLPVTFVSLKAVQQKDDIVVDWKVENETNMKEYVVEKSLDGNRFIKSANVPALNNGAGSYNWLDKDVMPGWNYYRIKSIDQNGKQSYSDVVKVMIEMVAPLITVYPNPIVNGVINVHLVNQPAGMYKLRLLNALGQSMVTKQVTREKGTSIEPLTWDYKLARGNYRIEITKPDGSVKLITVIY